MSTYLSEETVFLLKELVQKVTGFEENSDVLHLFEDYTIKKLQSVDSMLFSNKREVDNMLTGLSEKFEFHGFLAQAEDLRKFYRRYVTDNLPKDELMNRLNAVKFLTTLCERPTDHLIKDPFGYRRQEEQSVEDIDWPTYLREGIDRWSPPPNFDEDSDLSSDDEHLKSMFNESLLDADLESSQPQLTPLSIEHPEQHKDFSDARQYLKTHVQNSWFDNDSICMLPDSKHYESNIGILWENYVEEKTYGLLRRNKVITEYLVLREILWQFLIPTSAIVFKLEDGKVVPRTDITISSLRQPSFEMLIKSLQKYYDIYRDFDEFCSMVLNFQAECISTVPEIYGFYANCITNNFIEPFQKNLMGIEKKIIKQETTMTIISFLNELKVIFKPVEVLHSLHQKCILDYKKNTFLTLTTNLLATLDGLLINCVSKLEQDITLTLYLSCLQGYVRNIESMYRNNKWIDANSEFIIADVRGEMQENWFSPFVTRKTTGNTNKILQIISTDFMEIAKDMHLLWSLNRHDLLNNCNSGSLYEQLESQFLDEITATFEKDSLSRTGIEDSGINRTNQEYSYAYKFPNICPDDCKRSTNLDRLENIVDTSDGFLMVAFERYFSANYDEENKVKQTKTLFEKISERTKGIFRANIIIAETFLKVIRKGHSEYGNVIKNLLVEEYDFKNYLELLKKVYLFKEDAIFTFYRDIFKFSNWGSQIWLTSHLNDILIDRYPKLYNKLSVNVKDYWKDCKNPIVALSTITINFKIDWPVNIIITESQLVLYQEIFLFVLQIKWALFTLNRLSCEELFSKQKRYKYTTKQYQSIPTRLKVLRFVLLNNFANVQHVVLGYSAYKHEKYFDMKFENATSLDALINAHAEYIKSIHRFCMDVRNFNITSNGFDKLLYSVWDLQKMWSNTREVDQKDLEQCESTCKSIWRDLEAIISPRELLFDDSSDEE